MFTHWKNIAYAVVLSLTLMTTAHVQANNVSGLWVDSLTNYWAFIQSSAVDGTAQVVAVQVASDFQDGEVYLGGLTGSTMAISKLDNSAQLNAEVTGETLSGTLQAGADSTPVTAELFFAYQGSDYDGVWEIDAQNYLLVISVNNQGSNLTGVFDVTIADDNSIDTVLYIGALMGTGFTGAAVSSPTSTLQLEFTSTAELTGTYLTVALPPQSIDFTASKIITVADAVDEFIEDTSSMPEEE